MKALIDFLALASVVFSSSVLAHVSLEKTVPAHNAMLMKSPEALSLIFNKEVRVVKVSVKIS